MTSPRFKSKCMDYAKAAAMCGSGVGRNKNYKLGACLVDKRGKLITAKTNEYKTHPILAKLTEWPYLHAESNCIISHGLDNCSGLDLYVFRIKADGSAGMARPCKVCQQLIESVGVRYVWYTTNFGIELL